MRDGDMSLRNIREGRSSVEEGWVGGVEDGFCVLRFVLSLGDDRLVSSER